MKQIRLLDLGTISALRSQIVFHAAAYAMTEDTPEHFTEAILSVVSG